MENTWREEIAWAAGFFDGEGCFGIHGKHNCRVAIHQIHIEVLERFQKAVKGVGKIYGPYREKEGRNPIYVWSCTNREGTQAVYAMLYPFLGSVKREQGKRVLLARPQRDFTRCRKGLHLKTPENRTKYNQCKPCMQETEKNRPARDWHADTLRRKAKA